MGGSATFDAYSLPLTSYPEVITCWKYDPSKIDSITGVDGFTPLPNVVCESIQRRGGPDPGAARFRYVFDDVGVFLPPGFPTTLDELLSFRATHFTSVQTDDRILVFRELGADDNGDAQRELLFDGFAQIPQGDLDPDSQHVTFQCLGVAIRLWDTPIDNAVYRDADDPNAGLAFSIPKPVRFNPDDRPNCTPDGQDVAQVGYVGGPTRFLPAHPVFLEADLTRATDPRTMWTLGKAVRYILALHNDGFYVANPDCSTLDAQLQTLVPNSYRGINIADSSTYTLKDVVIREYDATGKVWPVAVNELIGPYGFRMDFVLDPKWPNSNPTTTLRFQRIDGLNCDAPLDLYLQPAGSPLLDPGQSNVAAIKVARDSSEIANRIQIECKPTAIEAAFILSPGFTPNPTDATARDAFRRDKLTATNLNMYRLYIFDEAGDGHYDVDLPGWVTTPGNFSPIDTDAKGNRFWVRRYRPGRGTLFSKGPDGKPLRWRLDVSTDYTGPTSVLWDGTGTWQRITGATELLTKRLGIYFDVNDPEEIGTGSPGSTVKGGTLRGITAQAAPDSTTKHFVLRLTCVIEADDQLGATAERRSASPTKFPITRRIDAADHFRREGVSKSSPYFAGGNTILTFTRDDTTAANAYARSVQSAHENAKFSGAVMIPRFTDAYQIGSRVRKVVGMNMSLRTNIGAGNGESQQYPMVIGLDWTFGDRQETTLVLSDKRAEPYRLY